ncbi:ParB/RepB/Spo0J family partition protein [Anaerostipes faecalis]|uniref:ParB/RepB/Spo0J family partition protein n=1 Tax=Anaerostipes faecalis TaxID=2738446 RepID=UPI001C1E0CB9|nr:ParB/RepB/Spo0J family partition protein [Anaerostipes faecalis]
MKTRTGQKLKLTTVEELLGVPATESSTEIDIDRIHVFKNHPFKVLDDEKMSDLVESIRVNGILSPVLVRPDGEDSYEMISGHRRMHAAKIVGLTMIPAIVREMSDDEAIVYMVDSNIQREELLPSEKAFAYKMKMDALRRQGARQDLTSDHNGPKLAAWSIGKDNGISGTQVKRYIHLTELIPELLDMVDSKRLQFTAGVEISYIDKEIQQWICEYIHENGNVKQNQIVILRQELLNGAITQRQLIDILNENAIGRIPKKKVTLSEKKLSQYFPPHYTSAEMEKVIVELLTNWKKQGGAENGF